MDTIALFFADLSAPSEHQHRSPAPGSASLPDDVSLDDDDAQDDVEAEDHNAAAVSVTQWTTARSPQSGVAVASLETIARLCTSATRPGESQAVRDTLPAPVRAWLNSGVNDDLLHSDGPELELVILAKLEELADDDTTEGDG